MQRYAMDFRDRYGGGFGGAGGPRRGPRQSPRRGYDEGFARGWGYAAGAPGGRHAEEGRYGYGYRGLGFGHGEGAGRGGGGYGDGYGMPGPRAQQRMRSGWQGGPQTGDGDADSVRAADIMTRNPEAVTPDTPVIEVARRMRDLDVGVIPVIDDPDDYRLQGIVTDRDIAIRAGAEGKDLKKTAVREIMSKQPETVREGDHVRDVFTVMKRARVRRVPVIGDDGRLVGIVAQADLAVNYAGLDLQRETEVEEVIEKISEPARPRWGREDAPVDHRGRMMQRFRPEMDLDLPDRVRSGWRTLRREARDLIGRGYDRDWR